MVALASDPASLLDELVLAQAAAFDAKAFTEEEAVSDPLMEVYCITPEMKRRDAQYWGRELGTLFQAMVQAIFEARCPDYAPGIRIGADEPCDLVCCGYAIDTKYRLGSGDSGTQKKLRANAGILREQGFEPLMLILRDDNLKGAIKGLRKAGWTVLTGDDALAFVRERTGVDLAAYLEANKGRFPRG